jgi:hypothetical protein
MENLARCRPRSCTFPCMVKQNTDRKAMENLRSKERIHSWPFLDSIREPGFLPSAANIAQASWNSSVSLGLTCDRPRTHVVPPESYLQKRSTEFLGSSDNFSEKEYLAHAATSLSEEAPPPQPPPPQTRSSQCDVAESPTLTYQPCRSMPIPHAPRDLPHRGGYDDLRHEYTLKEALELLPNEIRNSSNRFILDSSTGRIIPACSDIRHEQIFPDTEVSQNGIDRCEWLQNQFYGQNVEQNRTWHEPRIQCGNKAKHPTAKLVTKVVKQLTWIFFKLFKGPSGPSEQVDSVETCPPVGPRQFRRRAPPFQNVEPSDPFGEQVSLLAQNGREERDACQSTPKIARRLSITGSFGPTLAQSIEEATRTPKSADTAAPSSFRAHLHQPVPSASTVPLTRQTTRIVRFQEPEGRRCRPHLPIEISHSPSNLSSARTRGLPRQPRSPPPRPTSSLSDPRPDTNLSLRGGCLPTPRTRHPPPHHRVDPGRRPANNVRVPPGLWYLAGGRPVLRDKPDQPCYHGQPKPRRRFKSQRGLDQVDNSQRVPNAQPCEPLTFGHLRTWKQNSRPADRLNPQTGYMEPVYRPFWHEFAYSVSRGKVGTKRPRRELGVGQPYSAHGQGMAGGGDDVNGSRPTDIGQDGMGRGEPDPAMSMGTGRDDSQYDMSGGLGPDGAAGRAA